MVTVEVALPASAGFAECPTWDAAEGVLLWVEMSECAVHRFDPTDGIDRATVFAQPVAAAKPRVDQGLVLSLRDGVAVTDREGTALRWLVDWSEQGVRGNDAGIDHRGRLWVGTIAGESSPGSLFRLSPDGRFEVAVQDLRMSNGIVWSPDTTRMYHVDTPTGRIDVFDYDAATGRATNRRVFAEVTGTLGVPDGLCVDADGGVWVALFRGGAVRRYSPDGRLDREIGFPASLTTSCTFGGPDLTDLYVTTARRDLGQVEPMAGNLFVVPGLAQGCPATPFAG
ncbi:MULTISPECIES: SMP-30/gluconolactonase/LRE family protein [Streptomyces]|uniref:SMP-30/gluconolactonase/LRE family protein n=1 Tax=Streptomyces TaxID=1883 RepID=UPI0004ABB793|nr:MULTISPECIES: SMP-30/gluconolactonase/LRE family protein [Streptomyces]